MFARYIKLLFEGGHLALIGILERELRNQKLSDLLVEYRETLEGNIDVNFLIYLFPVESTNLDYTTWDIHLLASVLQLVFKDKLDENEIESIDIIKSARLDYAESAKMSLDTNAFLTIWTDLIYSLHSLTITLSKEKKLKVKHLIELYKKRNDKGCNADEYLQQLKESGIGVRTLHDVYKESTEQLRILLKKLSQDGIKFKQEHVIELKILTTCENEEMRKKAEDLLEINLQASVKGLEQQQFEPIRAETDKLVSFIASNPDVKPCGVTRKCIIWSFKISTPCSALHVLDYFSSIEFRCTLDSITNELHYLYGYAFFLRGHLTLESLSRLTMLIGGTEEAPSAQISIRLKSSSVDGIRSVLSELKHEKITNCLNEIAEQISTEIKDTVCINILPGANQDVFDWTGDTDEMQDNEHNAKDAHENIKTDLRVKNIKEPLTNDQSEITKTEKVEAYNSITVCRYLMEVLEDVVSSFCESNHLTIATNVLEGQNEHMKKPLTLIRNMYETTRQYDKHVRKDLIEYRYREIILTRQTEGSVWFDDFECIELLGIIINNAELQQEVLYQVEPPFDIMSKVRIYLLLLRGESNDAIFNDFVDDVLEILKIKTIYKIQSAREAVRHIIRLRERDHQEMVLRTSEKESIQTEYIRRGCQRESDKAMVHCIDDKLLTDTETSLRMMSDNTTEISECELLVLRDKIESLSQSSLYDKEKLSSVTKMFQDIRIKFLQSNVVIDDRNDEIEKQAFKDFLYDMCKDECNEIYLETEELNLYSHEKGLVCERDIFLHEGNTCKDIVVSGSTSSCNNFCQFLFKKWSDCYMNLRFKSHLDTKNQSCYTSYRQWEIGLVDLLSKVGTPLANFEFIFILSLEDVKGAHLHDIIKSKCLVWSGYLPLFERILFRESEKCLFILQGLDRWIPDKKPDGPIDQGCYQLPQRNHMCDYVVIFTTQSQHLDITLGQRGQVLYLDRGSLSSSKQYQEKNGSLEKKGSKTKRQRKCEIS